jgi:hypothetical protein
MSAGYWNFLHHNRKMLCAVTTVCRKPLAGLSRLSDLEQVLEQESERSEY